MTRIVVMLGLAILAAGSAVPFAHAAPRQAETMDAEALNTRFRDGVSAFNAGRAAEAAAIFGEVTAAAERLLGPDHEQTLIARSWLAFAVFNAGDWARGFVESHEVETRGARLGSDHAALDRVSVVLAVEDARDGRIDQGVRRLEASLERNRRLGDAERAGGVASLLAIFYRQLGREADATRVLALNEAADPQIDAFNAMQLAVRRGDDEALLAAADRMLAFTETTAALRVGALIARAGVLGRRGGRGDRAAAGEAESVLRAAVADPVLMEDPLNAMMLKAALADQLYDVDDPSADPVATAEALDLWRETAETSARVQGPRHPSTVGRRVDLALRLNWAGRGAEAEAILEALRAEEAAEPGLLDPVRRAETAAGLASVRLDTGRVAEAYAVLRTAAEDWRAFALSPGQRDQAGEALRSRDSLFRSQVAIAWVLAEPGG